MDLEKYVSDLECRTSNMFGRPVSLEDHGEVFDEAHGLWDRQTDSAEFGRLVGRSEFIENFPDDLRVRLEKVIATLELAFDGMHENESDLMSNGLVQIDEWADLEGS